MRRFRQLAVLHANALGVADQVWRAVHANFVTRGHQDRFQRAAGRAFTVGTRDGEHERCRFEHIKTRGDLAYALKPHIDGFTVQVFQIRKPRGQGRRGLGMLLFSIMPGCH